MTALMIAAEQNYPDILCDLLMKGAAFNLKDDDGKTAIDYASLEDRADVLKVFKVWYNFHWHIPGNLNYEMLEAAKNGQARLVGCLISAGADIDSRYEYDCCFASPQNVFKYLRKRELREKGLDIPEARVEEYAGYTGLHIAAHRGHDEVVKEFLNRGIDVNINAGGDNDDDEVTALTIASRENKSSIVKILVDHSASADSDDSNIQEGEVGMRRTDYKRSLQQSRNSRKSFQRSRSSLGLSLMDLNLAEDL